MNALTPPGKPLAKTASDECSPELWHRLTDRGLQWTQATMELAGDPIRRSELCAVADRLGRHADPCGAKAVIAALMPLVSLYGVPDRSENEWAGFWRFYIEALDEVPIFALRAGVSDYVAQADSEYFPKPGPLKALCNRHAEPIRMAIGRARRALAIPVAEAERYCR